ncbi:hypothetical protein SU69_06110 [Thermosipho melanesiensis]|uniref:Uncharacterized protein n=2 Tax=Thermosipho melanesiensis TaxID=46541 RepID=A6LMA6_THEM4|nr:hypothetical protein [Thermosipho melanesiensis]ABR31057.1 hypothetical protein Tmel_1203 [Thermosipho melanesiensis BI429]APT74151.1 hypothetical protein BW47_06410 [Thermosipho melanesiensis]OOC36097.1 hypothetical protein SU68_06180 [Thermosipho melanesiensis]OOC36914.1 hypothetical protein SU69_06110 [Thermosipho melanesiensis]OOC37665.1 hypothetical protein SU70_06120 [Thermosipho melanesiensis]
MPGFDGTGPLGTGPIGYRRGYCRFGRGDYGWFDPYLPDYGRRAFGLFRGYGRGFGRGFGRGHGRGFGRGGYGRGFGGGYGRGFGRRYNW